MKKRMQIGVALAVSAMCMSFTSFAEEIPQNQTGNFYFTQNGKEIYVSCNGELSAGMRDTNFVLGFYDNDVLINTELIKSEGMANSLSIGEFTVVLSQEPQNLTIKSFMWSADGTCEPLDTAAEISNIPSNAFECNGFVISNPKSDLSLDDNEVKFIVMESENFDGYSYGFADKYDYTSIVDVMNVGNTDISDHIFQYVKAYIVKDINTGEYNILDYSLIENFETKQVVEMKLSDIAVSENNAVDFKGNIISEDAVLYVNDCQVDLLNTSDIVSLKEKNQYENAKVTLVDVINRNNGTIDGIYDYVLVDCYESAVVDYVLPNNKIYFSESSTGDSVFYYDEEYMNINVYDSRGIKLGTEELQKLEGGTKLYFAYDIMNVDELSESEFADIIIDKEIEPKETEKTSEFKIRNVMNTLYISSSDDKNILGGNVKISSEGNMPALAADIIFYEGEKEVYTKKLEFPKYANQISLNETEIEDYKGTPTKVGLKIIGGDTEYYSEDIPIIGSEKLYYVNGRITATSKQQEIGQNKVQFSVESTDDFNGESYGFSSKYDRAPESFIMNIGEINPDNFLFMYSEALISKDESTGEFTIKSINPYDTNNIIGIDTNSVSDDDTTPTKLAVYTSDSLKTTKYDLATDCIVYVNGIAVGEFSLLDEDDLYNYIYENTTGKITLVDVTNTGSISTDGRYDYIFVDYYSTAVVDSVEDENINFKAGSYDINRSSMYCNEYTKIIKDGKTITADQLNENDVLSIKFDPVSGFSGSDFYEIQVSSKKIEGKLVAKNTENNTIKVDNNEYSLNTEIADDAYYYALNISYTCYLDVFDTIAYVDEAINSKDYGIIVGMFKSAGNDYMSVRLITADGDVKEYDCKDRYQEEQFLELIGGNLTDSDADGIYTKYEIENGVGIENCIVEYTIVYDKIKLKRAYEPLMIENAAYNADITQFGEYLYNNDIARILYVGEYLNDGEVYSINESNLIDGQSYDIYGYDMNTDRNIRFFIIKDTESEAFTDLAANPIIPDEPVYVNKEGSGMVAAMYRSVRNDYMTVRLITDEGKIEDYECKDYSSEKEFLELIGGNLSDSNGNETYTKYEIEKNVGIANTAVRFSVIDSKIKFVEKIEPEIVEDKYDEQNALIGSISIDDTCTMIDVSIYLEGSSNKVYPIRKDMLNNRSEYYVAKIDNVIYFFNAVGKLSPTTPLAVVKSVDGQALFNDIECTVLTVFRNNKETQIYVEDSSYHIDEGSIITYAIDSSGIIDPGEIVVLFEPYYNYYEMMSDTIAKNDFVYNIDNIDRVSDLNEYGGKLIRVGDKTDPDVYAYFGIMYQTTPNGFEMFTNRNQNTDSVVRFNVTSDTQVVCYNYNQRAGMHAEISTIPTQNSKIFKPYYTDSSNSFIAWDNVSHSYDCVPSFVFVKVDGGNVTDAVLYRSY